ncbi:MAG TPA: GDSL-type esterase/lipase family protein [Polyangiaceae bacterium]
MPAEPLSEHVERWLVVALSSLVALVSLTCLGRGELVPKNSGAPSADVPAPVAPVAPQVPPAASQEPPVVASAAPAALPDPTRLELKRFYAALAELEGHKRKVPVRILWLGDSHTAADYLTGTIRANLQQRFGAGGPGFVRIGTNPYRHTQVTVVREGEWRVEPNPPSKRSQQDDGVFGLGGMRVSPADGARASFEPKKGTLHGAAHFQLWFSLPEGASFRVELAGASQVVRKDSPVETIAGSPIARLNLSGGPTDKLELVALAGAPRFYGLTVEGSEPGLVLDTVGIDGARVATPLAWASAPFAAEVAARAPELVVFAFGTNEAFDADKVEKYRAEYRTLLERVHQGAPNADCLLVGPPDALSTSGGSEPRVTEIDTLQRSAAAELGCGYVSQLELMGGAGSFERWLHEKPARARPDRLHLTPKGYETLGSSLVSLLIKAYERR